MADLIDSLRSLLAPDTLKAVAEATGNFLEKVNSLGLNRPTPPEDTGEAHGFFIDPMDALDEMGLGYRNSPNVTTYETLRTMTERDTVLGAIVLTRVAQVASFCEPQPNKFSVGFRIRHRWRARDDQRMEPNEERRADEMKKFVVNMGRQYNPQRDGLVDFAKKTVRDSLTYDQVNFEKVRDRVGRLHSVLAVDPATIRIASAYDLHGAPLNPALHKDAVAYRQIVNGLPVMQYSPDQMAFCVRNPRTNLKVAGYGMPEPQLLALTVTSHLWAEEWNRRMFSQGSTMRGLINVKGSIPKAKFDSFRRQFLAMISGVQNAWRTPVFNTDGLEFVPMQQTNQEMGYAQWIDYLVKVASAIYLIDPSEFNFDMRSGAGAQQAVFMSTNEAQQKVSRDRGLRPLLNFVADAINKHLIWPTYDDLCLEFIGLDAKSEEQQADLRQKQVGTYLTMNEARQLDGLKPIENGDIPLNPTLIAYLGQKQMEKQQAAQGGGGGAPPGGGGGQGGDDDQAPPQNPYAGRFAAPPGDEEARTRSRLKHFAASSSGEDDASAGLFDNDWTETVHAALGKPDLVKGVFDDDDVLGDGYFGVRT